MARGFTLRRTVVVLRGGGEEGRGEEVDYDPAQQQQFQARRNELPLRGTPHARVVLGSPGGADRVPPLGASSRPRSTSRCDRRACSLGEALGREAATRAVRRLDARRERPAVARALPRAPLQARPGRASGRTSIDRRSSPRAAASTRSTSRASTAATSASPPTPTLYRRDRRGVPGRRGSRIPLSRPRRPRCSARTATASRGTRRSTSGATSRRCRSGRAA